MGKQINEYVKTRTSLDVEPEDLIDLDSTEDKGVSYESAKMEVGDFAQYIANLFTLYKSDGTLNSDREVNMSQFDLTFFNGNVISKPTVAGIDVGYSLQNGSAVDRGGLKYDVGLDSATLELKNTAGTYFNASDGTVNSRDGYWINNVRWGHTDGGNFNNFIGGTSGQNAVAGSLGNTGIGYDSLAFVTTGNYNTSLGYNVLRGVTTSTGNIGIGVTVLNTATGSKNIHIGNDSWNNFVSGNGNTGIGSNVGFNITGGSDNTLLGSNISAFTSGSYSESIALGKYATLTASNQMVIGDNAAPINNLYLGKGVSQASLTGNFSLNATSIRAGVTDINSNYDFIINGSQGTGTGTGGDIVFKTAPADISTGTTQNALVTVMTLKDSGILNIANIPTVVTGLVAGDVWSNSGVLTIV